MSGNAVDSVLQKLKNTIHYQSGGVADTNGSASLPITEQGNPAYLHGRSGNTTGTDDSAAAAASGRGQDDGILSRFLVMKMSWRGLYRRIMALRREDCQTYYIETYHPETGALTNSWNCNDVVTVKIVGDHSQEGGVFVMTLRHQQSTKDVKFACQERSGLLESLYNALYRSDATRLSTQIVNIQHGGVFPAYEFLVCDGNEGFQSGREMFLRISAMGVFKESVDGVDPHGSTCCVWKFMYASKPGVRFLGGHAPRDGFQSISFFSNTSMSPKIYAIRNRDSFCDALCLCAKERMGIDIEVDTSTRSMAPVDMLHGLMTAQKAKEIQEHIMPLSEWEMVNLKDSSERILVITQQTFIERFSQKYGMSESRPLSAIACIIRYAHDEQRVGIEWGDGSTRDMFRSSSGGACRDAFITALLYAAQRAAGRPIEVLPDSLGLGDPLIRIHYHPLGTPAIFHDAITESISLKLLQDASIPFLMHAKDLPTESLLIHHRQDESIRTMVQRLREFNASVPYSGISKDTIVDHRLIDALFIFLPQLLPGYRKVGSLALDHEKMVLLSLGALERICCSTTAKAYFFSMSDSFRKIYICLECDNDHVAIEAARLLLRLFLGTSNPEMFCRPSWEKTAVQNMDPMEFHQMVLASRMAKSVCFMSDTRCSTVINTLRNRQIVSPLLGTVIMEIVVAVACFPMAETTDMATRETMIQEVSSLGRKLFGLFRDPRLPVYNGLSLVMRTLAEGGIKAAEPMRRAALQEGAILTHLRCSLSMEQSSTTDMKSSRELVSMWCDGYIPAMELLRRIFPPGITAALERRHPKWSRQYANNNGSQSNTNPPDRAQANHSFGNIDKEGVNSQLDNSHDSHTVYSFLQGNWVAFWDQIDKDSNHAGLIWNETCRSELRLALKSEDTLLQLGRQKLLESEEMSPSWNFGDFRVKYGSLKDHIQVGNMYIELLVNSGDTEVLDYIRDPKEFVSSAYTFFLSAAESIGNVPGVHSVALEKQCLCLRAMSMVYSRYCGYIGPFLEVQHIIKVCDTGNYRKLRYYAMEFIQSLVNPEKSSDDESVRKISKENAVQLAHNGGVPLLCDAIATIHEVSNSLGNLSKDTRLITGSSIQIEPKIWFYMELNGDDFQGDTTQDLQAVFDQRKIGPVRKRELRTIYKNGHIGESTYVYRIGMKSPSTIASIRELRWWCDEGTSPYPERDFAIKAMTSLTQILALCPAKDSDSGVQLLPLPICHRILAQKSCISRIVQAILTNDPDFVNRAFQLLTIFVENNVEAMRTIYQTGVFFYALAYSGSDLIEPAKFLKVSHLQQKFQRSDGSSVATLAKKSILGNFLPESLLFILESYGPDAFSSAITGDSESPEIIWTHAMRCQKLIPHLWNHIGDFTTLLKESWALSYDYYPCPPLMYEEIEGEIWCHRYYLKHLCNTSKYPNWKIVDHLEFLQSALGSWKRELAKVGTAGMSVSEAAKLLELDHGENITESDMKKAYRRLARKYHPDRNPLGRDQFEAIHEAYLRLHSVREEISGPRDWCILLYIQAQCLIYRKCAGELAQYKYAGYPQIKSSLSLAGDTNGYGQILSKEFVPLLSSSIELCWLTCESSAQNAAELIRCGGIDFLEDIFSRCVSVASSDITPSDHIALVMENILKTFGIMAKFELDLNLLEGKNQLLRDVLKCCNFAKALNVVVAAVAFLKEISILQKARETLISFKIILELVPLLFGYDSTMNQEYSDRAEKLSEPGYAFMGNTSETSHVQSEMHKISIISCETLSNLVLASKPDSYLTLSLQSLFTPAIARLISNPRLFLRQITTFTEDHLIIWSRNMKKILMDQIERLWAFESPEYLKEASQIRYENLVGVTYISGTYLANFCKSPCLDGLEDAELCKDLVKTLHLLQHLPDPEIRTIPSVTNTLDKPGNVIECSAEESPQQMVSRNIALCLSALKEVLSLSPKLRGLLSTVASLEPLGSILLQVCEHLDPDPQFSSEAGSQMGHIFLTPSELAGAGETCLSVLQTLSSNAKCLVAMSSRNIPLMLAWIIDKPHSIAMLRSSCKCIMHIAEQKEFSAFCCESAGIFYLLKFVIIHTPESMEREQIKELIQLKQSCLQALIIACSNSLYGVKCIQTLGKLLPRGVINKLLVDEISSSYEMLHSSSLNPECIWQTDMLKQLHDELGGICADARRAQLKSLLQSPKTDRISWNLKEGFSLKYSCLDDHKEVGGIYIDLLLKNPGFSVRNPQGLFDSVMQALIQCPEKNTDDYVSVVSMLLAHHSTLSDHGVSSGYISKMFAIMREKIDQDKSCHGKSTVFLDCLKVIHGLSSSKGASDAMAKLSPPILEILIPCLNGEYNMILMTLEVIKNSLSGSQTGKDSQIKSALDMQLVPRLLEILDWRHAEGMAQSNDSISMIRYKCVEIINAMIEEGPYKDRVTALLEGSEIWAAYQNQKHDMFLPSGAQQSTTLVGLLEGASDETFMILSGETAKDDEENVIDDDLIQEALYTRQDSEVEIENGDH